MLEPSSTPVDNRTGVTTQHHNASNITITNPHQKPPCEEMKTGVANDDVDWLFRGKSKKIVKKLASNNEQQKESKTHQDHDKQKDIQQKGSSSERKRSQEEAPAQQGNGTTTQSPTQQQQRRRSSERSQEVPPSSTSAHKTKSNEMAAATTTTKPATSAASASSVTTPPTSQPEKTSKLDRLMGRSRSSSASSVQQSTTQHPPPTPPSSTISSNKRRSSSFNFVLPSLTSDLVYNDHDEALISQKSAGSSSSTPPAGSPGVTRSNSGKKGLFSSLSSKFKSLSSTLQQQQQQQQQGMDPNRAQNSQQQQQQNQANMQQARNRKPTKNQTTPAIAASVAMNMNDKGASMSPALQKAGSAVPNFAQQMSPNMTPGTIPPTNVLSPHSQSHIPMVSPTMAKAASAAALKNDTASSSRRGSTKPRGKSTAPVTGKKTSNAPTPQVVPATVPSTTNLSAAGTPNIRNKSATPLTAGLSPKSTIRSNSNTALASAKTPSPMTVSIPQPGNSSVFKKEEEYLSKLQLRKEEIRFRQKQRLDILSSSPVDLFLTTVADCLGINDEEIELINKIPETTADNINNTGKKKLTKAAQKLRDKEILNVSIQVGEKDKLIMSSKAPDKVMDYSIGAMSLAAVFKNLSSTGSLNNIALSGSNATTSNDIGNIYSHTGGVKRKFDEVEISPNSNGSPSASIMSESKKIKIDSPEDMFVTHSSEAAKGTNNSSLMDSGKEGSCKSMAGSATEVNDTNIWDWNFWTSIE